MNALKKKAPKKGFGMNELLENLTINGTEKPAFYSSPGYNMDVKGTKFFNPISCHFSFLMGQGDDEYKTHVGDGRYRQIEAWLVENVLPYATTKGSTVISSYDLKHVVENRIGGYVSNETVKFIMAMHEMPSANQSKRPYPINVMYRVTIPGYKKITNGNGLKHREEE